MTSANAGSGGGVLFYGDPHGEWRALRRACVEERPGAVVILGDCDLERPLREELAPVLEAGIPVHWIPGNHDTHKEEWFDRLWGDHPDGNLHARRAELNDIAVAGLGGIFMERVWYPRHEDAVPVHCTRKGLLRSLSRTERWRGGLPLRLRDAILPEDVDALRRLRADVLVSHEAPTCHCHGFVGIDMAARACRARLVVHGHHHESYEGALPDGTPVRGLAKAEVFVLRPEDLP